MTGRLPATVSAMPVLLAPVVGVPSAVPLPGDPPSWRTFVSPAMVPGSVVLTLRQPQEGQARPPAR